MAAVGLGIAEANFNLETENDEADVGMLFDMKLGYAFHERWAATVGVAPAVFSYKYTAALGGFPLMESTRNITFMMGDISGWYFQPIWKDRLKLFARLGLGATTAMDEWNDKELSSTDSAGVLLAGGAEWFFGRVFGLNLEIYMRTYGVTLEGMGDKEVIASGLVLNLMWR